MCLSLGLIGLGASQKRWASLLLTLAGSFTLVVAGHMYLPAAYVAAVAGLVFFVTFATTRSYWQLAGWTAGAIAGWSTFVPWALKVFSEAPGTRSKPQLINNFELSNWVSNQLMAFTIGTPFDVYDKYLRPNVNWLREHQHSHWVDWTLFWIYASTGVCLAMLCVAIWRSFAQWRWAIREPIIVTLLALLLSMPVLLFVTRLGSYIHYWFAVLPFIFYWLAWGISTRTAPGSLVAHRNLRHLAIGGGWVH